MNYDWQDQVQQVVARVKPGQFVFDRLNFTTGLFQMTPRMSEEVEEFAAKIENRPRRTRQEISTAHYTLEGQLRYVAAHIRKSQDIYKSCGIDISSRVGVLASLFNLGRVEERVLATFNRDGNPRWNNFGVFVEREAAAINGIVGPDYRPSLNHTRMDNACVRTTLDRYSELLSPQRCG